MCFLCVIYISCQTEIIIFSSNGLFDIYLWNLIIMYLIITKVNLPQVTMVDYPAMVPSVIGDHGLFRLSCYMVFWFISFQRFSNYLAFLSFDYKLIKGYPDMCYAH